MANTKKTSPAKKKAPVKKKAVAKKVVAKKTPAKKVVAKKAPIKVAASKAKSTKPVTPAKSVKAAKKGSSCKGGSVCFRLLAILFFGVAAGAIFNDFIESNEFDSSKTIVSAGGKNFVAVENLDGEFKVKLAEDSQFIIADGKTWIPVDGTPVELVILTDPNCGPSCDSSKQVSALKSFMTQAMLIEEVDVNSKKGTALAEDFELDSIPQFFLGTGGERFQNDEKFKGLLIEEDGMFLIDGSKVNFPTGKFIKAPEFGLKNEPINGNGKVTVVEFTDYQCPYCARLYTQNKKLVDKLIEDGSIEYVTKDFPLGFHGEAKFAHLAANCVLDEAGADKYAEMKGLIFNGQKSWSGKKEKAKDILATYADSLGVDVSACWDDEDMLAEIEADIEEGKKYGVTGTPALFIGGQFMPGAIPPSSFEKAVNDEMK